MLQIIATDIDEIEDVKPDSGFGVPAAHLDYWGIPPGRFEFLIRRKPEQEIASVGIICKQDRTVGDECTEDSQSDGLHVFREVEAHKL